MAGVVSKKGPKFTDTEREEKKGEAARLDRMGLSTYRIGSMLGVSHVQIVKWLQMIREGYNADALKERQAMVAEKLALLRDVAAEAYLAWERSKLNAEKVVTERFPEKDCMFCKGSGDDKYGKKDARANNGVAKCKSCKGTGRYLPPPRETTTVDGQVGDPAFLAILMDTIKQTRGLMGLDEAVKVDLSGSLGLQVFDWNALVGKPAQQIDPIHERMDRALNGKAEPRVVETTNEGG